MQILYLAIVSAAYGVYWQYVFKLIPNDLAPSYHM